MGVGSAIGAAAGIAAGSIFGGGGDIKAPPKNARNVELQSSPGIGVRRTVERTRGRGEVIQFENVLSDEVENRLDERRQAIDDLFQTIGTENSNLEQEFVDIRNQLEQNFQEAQNRETPNELRQQIREGIISEFEQEIQPQFEEQQEELEANQVATGRSLSSVGRSERESARGDEQEAIEDFSERAILQARQEERNERRLRLAEDQQERANLGQQQQVLQQQQNEQQRQFNEDLSIIGALSQDRQNILNQIAQARGQAAQTAQFDKQAQQARANSIARQQQRQRQNRLNAIATGASLGGFAGGQIGDFFTGDSAPAPPANAGGQGLPPEGSFGPVAQPTPVQQPNFAQPSPVRGSFGVTPVQNRNPLFSRRQPLERQVG